MIEYLFATPFYRSRVDSSRYDKTTIIESINHNFNIDRNRNEWDKVDSALHHSYNDDKNQQFIKLNYDSLVPLYKEHVENFLNEYFDKEISYYYEIVNYTCFGKNQYMIMHNHPKTCFSGIHYIKFNPNEHKSTLYWNPADWSFHTESFFPETMRSAHTCNKLMHSWMYHSYRFNIQEDDIVITPSTLRHSVPTSNSDELRMAIVFHIDITG